MFVWFYLRGNYDVAELLKATLSRRKKKHKKQLVVVYDTTHVKSSFGSSDKSCVFSSFRNHGCLPSYRDVKPAYDKAIIKKLFMAGNPAKLF